MGGKSVKAGQAIAAVSFLAVIFGFSIAGFISPDREFSDMENRTLKQLPEFTFEALKDGSLTEDIESYMSDQVFLKDELVTLKTGADRLLMKTYQNGVYFSEDGYYLQDYQENRGLIEKNVGLLNDFADKLDEDVEVSFMLVPNGISVLSDKLPTVTQTDNQLETIEYVEENLSDRITFYCPYDELKAADGEGVQVYYRTDHHWTADGAEIGFNGLMEAIGESVPQAAREKTAVKDFYGTLYSKAPDAFAQSDEITLYENPQNDVTVSYTSASGDHDSPPAECEEVGGVLTSSSLFSQNALGQKDKYSVFLGGNFSLIEIQTQGESDENVLIIKDSYANAVMPYFCDKYQSIAMIDMRYYHMEDLTVSEYIEENDIDRVIYLYNVDFINSDNNFVWLD